MTPQFVRIATELKLLDFWMAPFISVSAGAAPARAAIRRSQAPFSGSGLPFAAQILSRDLASAALCAKRMAELGIGFLSLNFACPSGDVLRSGSGGAILKRPSLMAQIAGEVSEALAGRTALILKLRSGWSDPKELRDLIPAACACRPDAILLHFRTVEEKYSDVDRDEALARLAEAVALAGDIPLIGNGDIRCEADAVEMSAKSGCAGVALARGFLADPFLLRRILGLPAPAIDDGRRLFLRAMKSGGCVGKAAGNLLEVARAMYGQDSDLFRRILRGESI